ncbi:chromosomal replication initiator protein DnaA [Amphibiibacter pelophylacis]|uniref:Chromosomal replication initiator protein DnaA n=1 Tax=Amphibiibacter pelophylacis TaxID=1799477 RepID=A0ACC6P1D1_9BURK
MPASPVDWESVKDRLTQDIPAPLFNTWIRPVTGELIADDTYCLYVSNRIAQDYIKRNLQPRITQTLKEFGFEGAIQIIVRPKPVSSMPAAPGMTAGPAPAGTRPAKPAISRTEGPPGIRPAQPEKNSPEPASADAESSGPKKDGRRKSRKTNLKSQFTFDNFVGGKSNLLATSIGRQIVAGDGPSFNPLYICGGVGLGKTHLMHAIGNALHEKNKEMKVFYVSATDFVTDVVSNYQNKTYDLIKEKYSDLDLLLIDDVQHIAGKERTQEEFFHIFEGMLARKSQVVLTSDTFVKKLKVSERLSSRFMAGVEVYIEPPEIEMRVSILLQRGREVGIALKNEVAFFIAQNFKNNVRELHGAVKTLVAQKKAYGISDSDISIDFVKQALKNILQVQNTQISAEIIQRKVAEFYNIKISDMHSKVRTAKIAKPRQIAMYLIRELIQMSYPDIGGHFGGKDHTTIIHAVKKITSERNLNSDLNKELHLLEQMIKE